MNCRSGYRKGTWGTVALTMHSAPPLDCFSSAPCALWPRHSTAWAYTHRFGGYFCTFPHIPILLRGLARDRRASNGSGGCVVGAAAAFTRAVAAAVVTKRDGALVVNSDAGGRTAVPLRLDAGAHRADGDLRTAQPMLRDSPQWRDMTLGGWKQKSLKGTEPCICACGLR